MHLKSVLFIVLCACLAGAGAVSAQTDANGAKRVATGRIIKVDAKKKVLTVHPVSDSDNQDERQNRFPRSPGAGGRVPSGGGNGPRRAGRTGGGRFPGGSYPGGGQGRRAPAPPREDTSKDFKVTVTDETAIKTDTSSMPFNLLRVGDRITIQGMPKGKNADLVATQITVVP